MSDTKTASWIAALERVRTELEGALGADAHWRALREADAQSNRPEHERALAANPVYLCWKQLSEAIQALQRAAPAGPAPGRRRVSLRDVLEQIRSNAALPDAETQSAPTEAERTEPAQTAPADAEPASASRPARIAATPARPAGNPPEAEEATVSFVIREPAQPEPADGRDGETSAPKEPAPPPETPEPAPGTEAEVVIVPRRR